MVGLCRERLRCFFADADPLLRDRNGRLATEFHRADGVHLTPAGYRIWSRALTQALHHAAQPNIVEGR